MLEFVGQCFDEIYQKHHQQTDQKDTSNPKQIAAVV
jgi:hypothetical protein